ncbi:MAG: TIGR02757 family protein [Syntrophales bacterium]|nr:TIGR02757 family protein [Syntrophales bacterium]
MSFRLLLPLFEELYERYNRRYFVYTDPLFFLYNYKDKQNREIAGFLTSALAYGRVAQIKKSVACVLGEMKPDPYRFLMSGSEKTFSEIFNSFKHRFTTGQEMASVLTGLKRVIEKHGSIEACFISAFTAHKKDIFPSLSSFVKEIQVKEQGTYNSLLPFPSRGSACKRLNLFLRWMIRKDEVDPGGWAGIAPSALIVPLDTHMYKTAAILGMTKRRQPDMKTAIEITEALKILAPEDPVKYDFALTRLGICNDADPLSFINRCRAVTSGIHTYGRNFRYENR